jgi:negative regulator of flagellin synthesis FlgM
MNNLDSGLIVKEYESEPDMTDAISNYGRRSQSDASLRSAIDKSSKKSPDLGAVISSSATPVKSQAADDLQLTNVAAKALAEPDFDRVKVDSIKQAIHDGQYPLNPKRIAESFHAIEQMIRD